jgi:hypothetical protein
MDEYGSGYIYYQNTGPDVADNITSVSIKEWINDPSSGEYVLVTNSSENYNSTTNPNLEIMFYPKND